MGQQQLIILVLAAIIVGLGIYGGLQWMQANHQSQERDQIVQRMNILVGEAKKYAARSKALDGGEGSFQGFSPPAKLATTADMRINSTAGDTWVLFQAFGTTIGNDGKSPVQVVGQYDKLVDKWTTLAIIN